MTFTDDDLTRLKEILGKPSFYDEYDLDLGALIARLEAAEKVCEEADGCSECRSWNPQISFIEQWRKAAGK